MSHKNHKHDHNDQKNNNSNNNTTLLLSIIIVLLVFIAIGAFYMGKIMSNQSNITTNTPSNNSQVTWIDVKVYDDVRCTTCNTDQIIESLKVVPGLSTAKFEKKDFSDSEVQDYLAANNITTLPIIIFPTNFVDGGINSHLKAIGNWEYYLNIGAEFNPFEKRSENGYTMVSEDDLKILQEETKYFKGNQDSPIAWFEYTNFACPACIQYHKSGIHDHILNTYGDKMKYATKHFHFFDAAYPAAEFIECAADQLWEDWFYSLEKNIFIDGILDVNELTQKAIELWANETELNACLETDSWIETWNSVKDNGARIFSVSATPTNIILNMETGEYIKSQDVSSDIQKFIWE